MLSRSVNRYGVRQFQRNSTAQLCATQKAMLVQQPAYNFGLYDYFFGKKDDKLDEKAKVEEKPVTEHISQTLVLEQDEKSQQRKDQAKKILRDLREMDRQNASENLYHLNKPQRKRTKEHVENLDSLLHEDLQVHPRVSISKFDKRSFERGLNQAKGEKPIPVSPKIGPYEVKDPVFGVKNYFWCSCGMSKKQPFCDRSHVGTAFKPEKFSLDSPTDVMFVCGCKLSKKAPFCDGETCKQMLDTSEEMREAKQGAWIEPKAPKKKTLEQRRARMARLEETRDERREKRIEKKERRRQRQERVASKDSAKSQQQEMH